MSSRSLSRSYVTVWGWARAPRENRRPSLTNAETVVAVLRLPKSQFASRTSPFEDYRTLRQYFHTRVHIHSCFGHFLESDFFFGSKWIVFFFFLAQLKHNRRIMTSASYHAPRGRVQSRGFVNWRIGHLNRHYRIDESEVLRKTSSLKEDNGPRT